MERKISVGEQIRQIRLIKGKTMREFAAEYGLSAAVINLLEHDRVKKPSMNTINSLSKALNKSLSEVCEMFGMETSIETPKLQKKKSENPRESLMKALLKYGLDLADLEVAIRYIDFLKDQNIKPKRYGDFR